MDLSLSPHEAAFRDEVRAWLDEHHPGPTPDGDDAAFEFRRAWQRALDDAGYAGLAWPERYGGRGGTLIEQAIFNEEMARAKAPAPANSFGLMMGGPVLIAHGTEEQKQRWLEPILSADEIWCQGFSEPEAGSDLASLKTRAVKDGDEWVVTGQKVWNLRLEVNEPEGHRAASGDPGVLNGLQGYAAHYCGIPTRTDPKIVACSFILSGLRVFDISDVTSPKEIAYYVTPTRGKVESGFQASDFAMSQPAFVPERREVWYTDGTSGFYALRVSKAVWPR